MDIPPFPVSSSDDATAPREESFRSRLVVMLTAVVPVALVATVLAAAFGRLDTALFFVGVPALLAFVVGMVPGEEGAGQLFQAITVALLLVSAFLHEGALCVLIVSPLVYGVAFAIHALVEATRRGGGSGPHTRHALGGLLVLLALEGAVPGLRINPIQEVDADRIVASDCSDFTDALARGPQFDPDEDRGLLLRVAQYPTPSAAQGTGLEVGDTWELAMPMGSISTEVTVAEAESIAFDVTADDARTTRWVSIQEGRLSWEQTDDGCRADVRITFERDLDPAFWFAPISSVFMNAGAEAFLAGLD